MRLTSVRGAHKLARATVEEVLVNPPTNSSQRTHGSNRHGIPADTRTRAERCLEGKRGWGNTRTGAVFAQYHQFNCIP
jgi:hypothetical protein